MTATHVAGSVVRKSYARWAGRHNYADEMTDRPRNGERGFFPSSEDEWIELARLREILAEIESLGVDKITAIDLLNRLGIEDGELDLLKDARRLLRSSGARAVLPGAADPFAPGRRHALGLAEEAEALAADPAYRAEVKTVLELMDELAAGVHEPIADEAALRLAVEEQHAARREQNQSAESPVVGGSSVRSGVDPGAGDAPNDLSDAEDAAG